MPAIDRPLTIVWFRQDLRLSDNPALCSAAASGEILPIYILDDISAGDWSMGGASRAWLHHSLEALDESLAGKLRFFSGDALQLLERLVEQLPVSSVCWNRCYEPWRTARDSRIKKMLKQRGVEAESFNGSLLWEPWEISKGDGTPYKVFTPFYRNGCLKGPPPRQPLPAPENITCFTGSIADECSLDQLSLLPELPWANQVMEHWQVGEQAAAEQLEDFRQHRLGDYRIGRDFPARESTSRLSPHLHFGEISPRQVWYSIEQAGAWQQDDNPEHFQRELAWREFSTHLLYHWPNLPTENFNAKFDPFPWHDDSEALQRWQRGRTGFPIIDAGMRELWQTGYMHNRVRMIVASFLIKNLLIDWRQGERWFWDCLVDADLANNSASWQWCAGSGADASPYFRIFNPLTQSEKFDPQGRYLARYCPELSGLPVKQRHQPWTASDSQLRDAGIVLGQGYPLPMVDLKETRERALALYKELP